MLIGIESRFDALELFHRRPIEQIGHEVELFDAHAVFARERATDVDAIFEDFFGGTKRVLHLRFVGVIVQKDGVDVPIAGVKSAWDLQPELLADHLDVLQHLRQLASRHAGILRAIAVADAPQRSERALARFPQRRTASRIARMLHLCALVIFADGNHLPQLGIEQLVDAVEFDQHQRLRIAGESEVERFLHGANHRTVHHLHRRRQQPRGDDLAHGFAGIGARVERRDQRAKARGLGYEADPELGDDAERPLAAADQPGQIERSVFVRAVLSAALKDRSIAKNDVDAQDVIAGDEVLEGVDAAGIGGGIAAYGAGPLAGGVGGKVVCRSAGRRRDGFRKGRVSHARFDVGHAIFEVDF